MGASVGRSGNAGESKGAAGSAAEVLRGWLRGLPEEWASLARPGAEDARERGPALLGLMRSRFPQAVDAGLVAELHAACEGVARIASRYVTFDALAGAGRAAGLYLAHGDLSRRARLDEHRALLARLAGEGDPWEAGHARSALGLLRVFARDLEGARAEFLASEELFARAGDEAARLRVLIRRVMALRMEGRNAEASELCALGRDAAAALGAKGDGPRLVFLSTAGAMAREKGAHAEALRSLREAAKHARTLPDSAATAFARYQYGSTLVSAGRPKEGVAWLEEAARLQKILDPTARVGCLIDLLRALRGAGDLGGAVRVHEELRASRLKDIFDAEQVEGDIECAVFLLEVRALEEARADIAAWGESGAPGSHEGLAEGDPALLAGLATARRGLAELESLWDRAESVDLARVSQGSDTGLLSSERGCEVVFDWPKARLLARPLGAPVGALAVRDFARATLLEAVLWELLMRARRGETVLQRPELSALVARFTSGGGEALRKASQRTIREITELGLVRALPDHPEALRLPGSGRWISLRGRAATAP